MNISGPIVNKTVTIPEHTVEVLDADAYWNLDYRGNLAAEGDDLMCLYAKVAWPTLLAAQQQFRMEAQAREQERSDARKRTTTANQHDKALRRAASEAHRKAQADA